MNILVYGNWRTGTNLLINILIDMGYYDFNEYYASTGVWHPAIAHPDSYIVKKANNYLISLIKGPINNRSVLKVNFPHSGIPSAEVLAKFNNKILIYRSDILQSAISRIVAESRNSWVNDSNQPEYKKSIDQSTIQATLDNIYRECRSFMINKNKAHIDHVVNYESDLLPYIKLNGSAMLPSDNYQVDNHQEILQWYQSSVYPIMFAGIIEYFENMKINNSETFSEYIEKIRENINENK